MIEKIKELPPNMIGFKTAGHIIKGDVDFVTSEVRLLIEDTQKLNYLLFFDNSPTDFTLGAWPHEALLSIKNITKWTRAAIVTDCQRMINFTKVFNKIMPGEFKGFKKKIICWPLTGQQKKLIWIKFKKLCHERKFK